MTDKDLENIVNEAIYQATTYTCTGACGRREPAEGTPPDHWWDGAKHLLADHGYTITVEHLDTRTENPLAAEGAQLNGGTSGPLDEIHPCMVRINDILGPADMFRCTAHETAHVVLEHAPTTEQQSTRFAMRKLTNYYRGGNAEIPDFELAAELAALVVLRVAGMPWPEACMCYLIQRLGFVDPRNGRGDAIREAAVRAAKEIIPAFIGEDMELVAA